MGTNLTKKDRNRESIEFVEILKRLKLVLREKKISYAELADKIGLSESGLKKIFSSQDCSYTRLAQITRALGFRLVDLLDDIDKTQMRSVQFSPVQQQYFLKHVDVFNFFVLLVVERWPVEEIQKKFNLSEANVFKILKKLDEIGAIQLLPDSRLNLPPLALVRDFGTGPLLEKTYQEWGKKIVEEMAYPRFQNNGQFFIRSFRMKQETYLELLERLTELEKEFLKRSVREMSVGVSKLTSVRFIWLTDNSSFVSRL